MTANEINTLENKAFRLECEILQWRRFRTEVESFLEMNIAFGFYTEEELNKLKEELNIIKYY